MCNLEEFFSAAVSLREKYLEESNTSSQDIEVETWAQIVAECYQLGKIPKYIELKHTAPINTNRIIAATKDLFRAVSIEVENTDTTDKWLPSGHYEYVYVTLCLPI